MFLQSILLVFKAGTSFGEVKTMDREELEEAVSSFCLTAACPRAVREEYEESQLGDQTDQDDDHESGGAAEPELLVEPEPVQEDFAQDIWMEALRPIHANEQHFYEADND